MQTTAVTGARVFVQRKRARRRAPIARSGCDEIAGPVARPPARGPERREGASPCLASRIPYGTPVDPATLGRIDRAERAIRRLGFSQLRVRHHGDLGRLELPEGDLERALEPEVSARICDAIRSAGYARARPSMPSRSAPAGSTNSRPAARESEGGARKTVPVSTSLSTSIASAVCLTIASAIVRPSPTPWTPPHRRSTIDRSGRRVAPGPAEGCMSPYSRPRARSGRCSRRGRPGPDHLGCELDRVRDEVVGELGDAVTVCIALRVCVPL